jgi:trans-aconitate methyltransferase
MLSSLLGDLDYTGLDAREEAIEAAKKQFPCARFVCARAEEWAPAKPLDVVVFNESLYYLVDSAGVLKRFWGWLRQGGILAISIYRRSRWWGPNHRVLGESRRLIKETCDPLHDVDLSSGNLTWTILLGRKNGTPVSGSEPASYE